MASAAGSGPRPTPYPLTVGNLHTLMEYRTTADGQHGLVSRVARPASAFLCPLAPLELSVAPTWSSVQVGRAAHAELHSALLCLNHSCRPSVEVVVRSGRSSSGGGGGAGGGSGNAGSNGDEEGGVGDCGFVRVAPDRALQVGDELTFFYPSTEWAFARPFRCTCGAGDGVCLGMVQGARELPREVLGRYFVNKHIAELVAERDGRTGDSRASDATSTKDEADLELGRQ